MLFDEFHAEGLRLGIEDVVDVALAIDGDIARLVPGDGDEPHALEQLRELGRLGVRELDELEAIGTGRVGLRNGGRRRIVRKRTHGSSFGRIAALSKSLRKRPQKACIPDTAGAYCARFMHDLKIGRTK